jgi:ABC-type methionine transport system ATPase subunit
MLKCLCFPQYNAGYQAIIRKHNDLIHLVQTSGRDILYLEATMAEQSVRLTYPPSLLKTPIIYQLIRQYDVTVNILRAQLSQEQGWLVIHLSGEERMVNDAITWLKAQGIQVDHHNK